MQIIFRCISSRKMLESEKRRRGMQTGHNTCLWTPERVRFMANAAACGNFPAVLARAAADGAPESVCP